MRWDASLMPQPEPRRTVDGGGVTDLAFMARCLTYFDRGLDSADIARLTFERECVVAWCIAVARERRLEG